MSFFYRQLRLLGLQVTADGVTADPEKVAALRNMPKPQTADQLMSLIGLAQFYAFLMKRYALKYPKLLAANASFGREYATFRKSQGKPVRAQRKADTIPIKTDDPFMMGEPTQQHVTSKPKKIDQSYLRWLKQTPVVWDTDMEGEFKALIDELCNPSSLATFNPDYPTVMETDASYNGISAVLSQLQPNADWKMVSAYSRGLAKSERNEAPIFLEAMAIVFGLAKNRDLLEGLPFSLVTDHEALQWFLNYKGHNRKLIRLSDELNTWKPFMHISYRPGVLNVAADALSRLPARQPDEQDVDEFSSTKLPEMPDLVAPRPALFVSAHAKFKHKSKTYSPVLATVMIVEAQLDALHLQEQAHADAQHGVTDTDVYKTIKDCLSDIKTMDTTAREAYLQLSNKDVTLPLWRMDRGLLWYRNTESDDERWRIYVPTPARRAVMEFIHDKQGHFGILKTHGRLIRTFWWPHMRKDVERYVRGCKSCQSTKSSNKAKPGEMHPVVNPSRPWSHIHLDFLGRLPMTDDGYDMILVVIDRTTRRVHLIATKSTITAAETAYLLAERVIALHGLPSIISTDEGTQFLNKLWTELTTALRIQHRTSPAHHHEPNGLVERMNRTIGEILRNYTNTYPEDWKHFVPLVEYVINSARITEADVTPFELDIGYNPALDPMLAPDDSGFHDKSKDEKMEILQERRDIINDILTEAAVHAKERYNNTHVQTKYKVGDDVMLSTTDLSEYKHKLASRWIGPCKVKEALPERDVYRLEFPPYLAQTRIHEWIHVSRLKAYHSPEVPIIPPAATQVDDHDEYEVDFIVKGRNMIKSGRGWKYRVRWKGYGEESDTWEYAANLRNAPDKIAEFHRRSKRPILLILNGQYRV